MIPEKRSVPNIRETHPIRAPPTIIPILSQPYATSESIQYQYDFRNAEYKSCRNHETPLYHCIHSLGCTCPPASRARDLMCCTRSLYRHRSQRSFGSCSDHLHIISGASFRTFNLKEVFERSPLAFFQFDAPPIWIRRPTYSITHAPLVTSWIG